MRLSVFVLLFALLPFSSALGQQKIYQPNWRSINSRRVPAWFDEAKFGIFIHWGVYSVPAWGPKDKYAEWYWHDMQDHNGPTWKFHVATYGEKFQYQDFAPRFNAEMFDPDRWADIFERSGARYVVLTSKHHEGFCLWPCPDSWNWNAVDVGPHRDLAGDLTKAVQARGIKMGFYYSLYEWYNPLYHADVNRYVDEHMLPQMKDLVERYHPSILWTDGEWEFPSAVWKSTEFLTWLFNDSSVRDEIVINDRWGKDTRGVDGGFYTSEYGKYRGEGFEKSLRVHKWEEDQGIGSSFGYNRNEDATDYKTPGQLITLLANTVSEGGNLLLDIGPTGDGRIPVIMQERLLQLGDWLKVNGEAIYGTHPWRKAAEGEVIRYTAKDGAVYAIALKSPGRELVLEAPQPQKNTVVTLLGSSQPLRWRTEAGKLHIELPATGITGLAGAAMVFKLTDVQ
jgi:alpha-L-fucosidase